MAIPMPHMTERQEQAFRSPIMKFKQAEETRYFWIMQTVCFARRYEFSVGLSLSLMAEQGNLRIPGWVCSIKWVEPHTAKFRPLAGLGMRGRKAVNQVVNQVLAGVGAPRSPENAVSFTFGDSVIVGLACSEDELVLLQEAHPDAIAFLPPDERTVQLAAALSEYDIYRAALDADVAARSRAVH